jgi:hypothetical protein
MSGKVEILNFAGNIFNF